MPPYPGLSSLDFSRQVATFGTSLRFRLSPFAAPSGAADVPGAAGAESLWRLLVSAYGDQPGAIEQLELLFCFLPAAQQPVPSKSQRPKPEAEA